MRLHRPDLHRAGMGPQHMRRARIIRGAVHVERVHLGPRRVMRGDVQRVEIIPVRVDARAFRDRESHIRKDRRHFLGHLADRMDRPGPAPTPRQGHVQPLGPQPLIQRGIAQSGLLRGQGTRDLILQRIQRGTGHLPLLRAHLAQFAHLQAQLALLAQRGKAHILDAGLIPGACDQIKIFAFQIVHHMASLAVVTHPERHGPFMQEAARP